MREGGSEGGKEGGRGHMDAFICSCISCHEIHQINEW